MAQENSHDRLAAAAALLGKHLLDGSRRIVLAESCTAGLVSASLAATPGISDKLCGCFVTYRESAKTAWLGIDPKLIARFTPVSQEVTDAMAIQALERTAEANLSAAITGHLGPNSPSALDGCVFLAIAERAPRLAVRFRKTVQLVARGRLARQYEAAWRVITALHENLVI